MMDLDFLRDEWKKGGMDMDTDCICFDCPNKDECEYAFDFYNFNCEPLIDCLAAK